MFVPSRCIQEARLGISVWGYVHLEWPSDKAQIVGAWNAVSAAFAMQGIS